MHIKKEYKAPETEWYRFHAKYQILQTSDGGMGEGGEIDSIIALPDPIEGIEDLPGIL